jgi:hypothetical protein
MPEPPAKVDVKPVARDEEFSKRLQSVLEATGWFFDPRVMVFSGRNAKLDIAGRYILRFTHNFWASLVLDSYSYSMKWYSYSCSKRLGPVEYETSTS